MTLLIVAGLSIVNAPDEQIFDTNILALLPKSERNQHLEKLITTIDSQFERKLVFILDMPTDKNTQQIANQLHAGLAELEREQHLNIAEHENAESNIPDFYKRLRFSFLSNETMDLLRSGRTAAFEREIISSYFSPVGFTSSQMIREDPLRLTTSLIEEKFNLPTGMFVKNNLLMSQHKNRHQVFMFAELNTTPFDIGTQNAVISKIKKVSKELNKNYPDIQLHTIGLLPHAHSATQKARGEISLFGAISFIGIITLFIVFFRSPRPILLTIFSIAFGCFAGLVACIAIFGKIHLLTLVFGTSLIGISVDYSLHYFCTGFNRKQTWVAQKALAHVFSSITLGLITSVIAFAGLIFAPFPGTQQMALFSIVGLISAYLCVVCFYPALTKEIKFIPIPSLLNFGEAYVGFWKNISPTTKFTSLFILLAISATGIWQLNIQDDVRALQKPDEKLLKIEHWAQSIGQQKMASQFFLVEASNDENLLIKQELLTSSLRILKEENRLGGYSALSDFVPSSARQQETKALLSPIINNKNGSLDRIASQIGLPKKTVTAYRATFAKYKNNAVKLSEWLQHPASKPYRHLWLGKTKRGSVGLVQLGKINDIAALNAIAQEQPGVYFVDKVATYASLFEKYRKQIGWITVISYLLIWLLLISRYGIKKSTLTMLVPILSCGATIGAMGLLGEPFTLFHMMALLLVLGIGIDYSIFFSETRENPSTTMLAVTLSAFTTILAFGLLAFSHTEAIKAFGLVIAIGVIINLILSPLAHGGQYAR